MFSHASTAGHTCAAQPVLHGQRHQQAQSHQPRMMRTQQLQLALNTIAAAATAAAICSLPHTAAPAGISSLMLFMTSTVVTATERPEGALQLQRAPAFTKG